MGDGKLEHVASSFDAPLTSESQSFLRDTAWMESIDEPRSVHCVRKLLGGEFRVFISVYLEANASSVDEREFALSLSEALHCATLIPSAEQDPYLLTYLAPDGTVKDVLVQDERGEIEVCIDEPAR